MPLTNYKLRPPLYPAIQWDGTEDTWEAIRDATPIPVVGDFDSEVLTIHSKGQDVLLQIDHWVYVDRNGELQVMTNEDFTATFEIA